MKLTKVSVTKTIEEVTTLLDKEKQISPVLKAAIQLLLAVVTLLAERLSLNSSNSSKPPSTDLNRKKKKKGKDGNKRNPGGQPGRNGTTLEPVDDPDEIISTVNQGSPLALAVYSILTRKLLIGLNSLKPLLKAN